MEEVRTNVDQVRICRADLRDAVLAMDSLIQGFRGRPFDAMEDTLDALKKWCEVARVNTIWLEAITQPRSESE